MTNRPAMTLTEWGLLIFLSVLWGGTFYFNRIAVAALPPFTVVAVRVSLAALTLGLLMARRGPALPTDPAVWRAFFGMGLLNNAIPFSLIVWGQSHIASGVAAILNASTPLFTVILAHWWTTDERMTPARLTGVLLGLTGVAVMMGGGLFNSAGIDLLAQGACLLAAVSYAVSSLYGRRFQRLGVPTLTTAFGSLAAAAVILLPVSLLVDRPWTLPMPGAGVFAALIGLAVLSSGLAYLVFYRLLATVGATNIMLVTLLVPVTAILLGVLLLGEHLLPRHVAGMALIALGLAAIDGRPFDWLRRRLTRPG